MTLPSGLVFYINFKYGTSGKFPYERNDDRTLRTHWDTYWEDSVYGQTYGTGAPYGGFFGAGRYSYSQNMKTASVDTVTSGSASLAQINYDDSLNSASFYYISFKPADASTASMDWDAVRSFVLVSGST